MAGTTPRTYRTGDPRTQQVQFRVTTEERARLHAEMERRGYTSLSDFARHVCLEASPDLDSAQAELQEVAELEARVLNLANTIRARHGMGGK